MEYTTAIEIITQVGFPIFCVLALGLFVWKSYQQISEKNQAREEKYMELYREQVQYNLKFSETLTKISETLTRLSDDVEELKEK